MSVTKARLERDEYALKALLRNLSRFWACRATDKTLAEKLRWNARRVQRVLRRVVDQEDLEVVTTPAERRAGRWSRRRTIYFRSKVDCGKGALMVANMVRERGKTNRFSDEAACGQLRCTPSQFKEWLATACAAGHVKTYEEDGKRVIERIGNFPAVALPNRYCEVTWVPPAPHPDVRARILELVANKRRVNDIIDYLAPTTNAELARCIGGSVSYAKRLTRALIEEGRLHSWKNSGRRYLSTEPPPPVTRPARSAADPMVTSILQTLANGPRPAAEVATALRVPSLPASIMKKARGSGVAVTRFGRLRVLSLGPLAQEYVEDVRLRQRAAKAVRDAERRRQNLLGIDRKELALIDRARELVSEQFWERYGRTLQPGEYTMVLDWSREFAQFVTFERALAVYKALKAAGGVPDAAALASQCLGLLFNAWLESRPKQAA